MTDDEILGQMMELLSDETKWCQGRFDSVHAVHGVQHCLLGAWRWVVPASLAARVHEIEDYSLLQRLAGVIREQYPEYNHTWIYRVITMFNDSRRTTFADVRAVLEKGAAHEH